MERIQKVGKLIGDAGGMIGVRAKVNVASKEMLGLVYTPGVGAVCKAIQADLALADTLTNRANSCLVLSDCSGYPGVPGEDWAQERIIPLVEAQSLFLKCFGNIDAYPLLADAKLTVDGADLFNLLDNCSNSYAAILLLKLSDQRNADIREHFAKTPFDSMLWTTQDSAFVEDTLTSLSFDKHYYRSVIVSTIIRIALDTQIKGFIPRDIIRKAIEAAAPHLNQKACQECDRTLILTLVSAFKPIFEPLAKGKIRCSSTFLSDYLLYNCPERKPVDTRDYHKNDNNSNAIYLHERFRGMIETYPVVRVTSLKQFTENYSSRQLTEISDFLAKNPDAADYLTLRRNYSSIVTNGTAILGFGDIGSLAGMPVMEGKCVLFKNFGGVNMMPLCIKEKNPDKVIQIVRKLSPIFTSINMEDIKAPDCFKIETELRRICRPPVFHDDQHGTAIVVAAAILNYCRLASKDLTKLEIVINGAGAAGLTICKLLMRLGAGHIVICDTKGTIFQGRKDNMNKEKQWIAEHTNQKKVEGTLSQAVKNTDIFIGVSAPKALSQDDVRSMNPQCMVLALANPVPEIYPAEAKAAGAFVTATGRGDFDNQVNNSLAFPGIFKAIRSYRIPEINEAMYEAAARAIAAMVPDDKLNPSFVIPSSMDQTTAGIISRTIGDLAVKQANIRPVPTGLPDLINSEQFDA